MHFIFTLKYIAFYTILHDGKHIISGGEFREKVTLRRKFHEFRHSLYHHAKCKISHNYVHPLARSTRCILSFFTKKIGHFSTIFDCARNVSLFPRARRAVCAHTRFSLKIKYRCISFSHLNTLLFTLFCTPENTVFRGENFVKK